MAPYPQRILDLVCNLKIDQRDTGIRATATDGRLVLSQSFNVGDEIDLSVGLHQHPKLEEFSMYEDSWGKFSQYEATWGGSFPTCKYDWDPLMAAMGTCLRLKTVRLHFSRNEGGVSWGLAGLCSSNTIASLTIENAIISDPQHFGTMFAALQGNTSLKHLSSMCHLKSAIPTPESIGNMLENNHNLESLVVNVADTACDTLQPIVDAMESHNRSLQLLALVTTSQKPAWPSDTLRAFVGMVQKNTTLKELPLIDLPRKMRGTWYHQLIFFLKLNKGRRHFLLTDKDATQEDWCNEIIRNSGNLRAIHYYLSMNPSLLHHDCIGARGKNEDN